MDHYQHAIERTLKLLDETKEKLIDQIFVLAINGELKEWSETVEVGEDFYFSRDLFEGLDDNNIKILIKIIADFESGVAQLNT